MNIKEKPEKWVLLLAMMMMIASSASSPIDKNETQADKNETQADKMTRYRLPTNAIPRAYKINIEPNMEAANFTWSGSTVIDIDVVAPTTVLTLHAHPKITFDESFTRLVDADGKNSTPIQHSREDETEFFKIKFDREIPVGRHNLSLKFEGVKDTKDLDGFFKASRNRNDTTVAATQFEPTHARAAFPCWDEPDLKAHFRLSIKHFPNYTAVSNMPEISRTEHPDGKVLTTFDTTPIMSTYLVTFVIADYESVYNEYRNSSLHSSARALNDSRYMLDLGPKIVRVMESFTGCPYGMPRIGSVLIPSYSAGATENWGMVSYFEGSVVVDRTTASTAQVDGSEMIVAHELAHSWFGNRVTARWWDDIWLSEAFAAYFELWALDQIYENRGYVELTILRNNQLVFTLDNGKLKPTKWTAVTPEEIRSMFGISAYQKGAAIVHMFRNAMGDDVFRAGIQKYMARRSFKGATTKDLTDAFQEAYNEGPNKDQPLNVEDAMVPWLVQKGHPMVNVTRNYTTGDTRLSQESVIPDSTDKWSIPLTYATKSRPNFTSTLTTRWFGDKEDHVEIDGIDKDDWIVLNIGASGFYRINYDDENWNRLAEYLSTDDYKNIHVQNRVQLLSDALYLTRREPDRYTMIFYKLAKYLSRETEYQPWRFMLFAAGLIESSLGDAELYGVFKRLVFEWMEKFVEKVGFEVRDTDDHFTKLARTDVIRWLCRSGHSGCSEWAASKLIRLANDPTESKFHPDQAEWALCAGLKGLNDTAAKQFAEWAVDHKREELVADLRCTEKREVHKIILNKFLAEADARGLMEAFEILLTSSDENFNSAVDFFLDNYQAMKNADLKNLVSEIVNTICRVVSNEARLAKLNLVLQSDAVIGDPYISPTKMLAKAEKSVARKLANDVPSPFVKSWKKLLSGDNSVSGTGKESR